MKKVNYLDLDFIPKRIQELIEEVEGYKDLIKYHLGVDNADPRRAKIDKWLISKGVGKTGMVIIDRYCY